MELKFPECKTILDTLPTGYYTGRKIPVELSEKAPTSAYSPMEDKIIVSYPIIARRMRNMPEGSDKENAVRSMLYHEVSHAILTTKNSCFGGDKNNIFEDERIETVLKDYYMNVDFKKQWMDLHDGKVPTPTNALQAFTNAVRYRCAPNYILQKVESMIKTYGSLHRNMDWYEHSKDNYSATWNNYTEDIAKLYETVARKFKEDPQAFTPQGQQGNSGQGNQNGENQQSPQLDSLQNGQPNGQQNNAEQTSNGMQMVGTGVANGQNDSEEKENKEVFVPRSGKSPLSNERIREICRVALDRKPRLNSIQMKQLDEFTRTVDTIISNFNKKNSGGNGINTYSGVFNPRAVTREDYRYFERSSTLQGNNRFGTCHLNLFIDCSGSMSSNEKIVNAILMSLSEIERKHRNFSMDVSFLNEDYYDCKTVEERNFSAHGGNDVPTDMKERLLKRQLPNTCNYNIVLFDGDAFTDTDARSFDEEKRRFGAFDYKQTTLITNRANESYLGDGFRTAKVVVTDNYTSELISHITQAMTIAFA